MERSYFPAGMLALHCLQWKAERGWNEQAKSCHQCSAMSWNSQRLLFGWAVSPTHTSVSDLAGLLNFPTLLLICDLYHSVCVFFRDHEISLCKLFHFWKLPQPLPLLSLLHVARTDCGHLHSLSNVLQKCLMGNDPASLLQGWEADHKTCAQQSLLISDVGSCVSDCPRRP